MEFELNTTYTVTTPKGTITPHGKTLINAAITSVNMQHNPEWKELNPDNTRMFLNPLPDVDGFEWTWLAKGGKFPKRVSKWYFENMGIKCPDVWLEKIGNLAREHSTDAYTYTFDFVDEFEWTAGDFGDNGSCYWGSNEEARYLLQQNGFWAIRFFENNHGFARAWVYPAKKFYVLFNGYGLTTLQIAKVFAEFLGTEYRKINLYNNDQSSGLIYINGSGSGYAIGQQSVIETIYTYDFGIHTPNTCANCGDDMGENTYTTPDGDEVCQDCFYDRYDYCQVCYEAYRRDDMYYVESEEIDVCDDCLSRHYTRCEHCDEYWHDSRITVDKDGRAICENCQDN